MKKWIAVSLLLVPISAAVASSTQGFGQPQMFRELSGELNENCVGLACAGPGDSDYVPGAEASGIPEVGNAGNLLEEEDAGFYEWTSNAVADANGAVPAVAYVITPGSLAEVPSQVGDLPEVEQMVDSDLDYSESTVAIVDGGAALLAYPPVTIESQAERRSKRDDEIPELEKPKYPCLDAHFCLYSHNFGPFNDEEQVSLGPSFAGDGWKGLAQFNFNDKADAMKSRRQNDSLLARHTQGDGTRYCARGYSSDTKLDNNPIGNDEASSFKLKQSSDPDCSGDGGGAW